ncbi:R3HC1 protein, partial [Formicarius rufipectus]|nr:R3HC1 protein [Formicarius rufipectus]
PGATLAQPPMDGVFLSPSEDEFVGRIVEELQHFLAQGQHHRVLLFPPLSSRLRYLIHRTVENMDLLSSFSVGEGWRRRTVICHSAVRLPSETSDPKPGANPPRAHRPAQPWGRGGRGARPRHGGDIHGDNSRASVGSGRITRPPRRKPEKALYVPKVMRKKANWRERDDPGEADGDAAPGDETCPKNSIRDIQEELGEVGGGPGDVSVALGEQQEPGEEGVSSQVGAEPDAERPPCGTDGASVGNGDDSSEQEGRDKDCAGSLPAGHRRHSSGAEEQELSSPEEHRERWGDARGQSQGGKVPVEEEEDKDVADLLWRELHFPAGDREQKVTSPEDECTAELLAEIVGNLRVKDISIKRVSVDCAGHGDSHVSEGDLGHVTEIYDFPSSLKTEDLLEMFSDFHESGFKIQWVDDTHALGIFSSLSTASQALGRRYPCLKLRPLVHATKQSKLRALQRPKLLHLGKERPQTDTAVARRLVSHALGWRHRQQEGSGNEVFQPETLEQQE